MTESSEESLPPVSASSLHKKYGNFTAVEDSSFEVQEGEVFGIVGPNGAGKTTTLKMLAGLIEPTAGEAHIAGIPSTNPEMRHKLGFLPEESPLYEDMTGVSYLEFFADLYDVPSDEYEERIHGVLDRLDLDHRERKIGDMSKGMKRKVAIARSLVNDPEVLIYDEPASGLDPLTTNYIIEFTRELTNFGKTVVFSAHNLYHVESICDRVLIMNNGHVVARGSVDEIRAEHGSTEYTVAVSVPLSDPVETSEVGRGHACTVDSMDAVEAVREAAQAKGGEVVDIRTDESSLEDIFINISKENRPSGGECP